MTTATRNECSIIGGCEYDERREAGHVRECGCHRYGWTLCPTGRTLMARIRVEEFRHGFRSRERREAQRTYRDHNPD
jgi:hypothetical protein